MELSGWELEYKVGLSGKDSGVGCMELVERWNVEGRVVGKW